MFGKKLAPWWDRKTLACLGAGNLFVINVWHSLYVQPHEAEKLYFYALPTVRHYAIIWGLVLFIALTLRALISIEQSTQRRFVRALTRLVLLYVLLAILNNFRHYVQSQFGLTQLGLSRLFHALGSVYATLLLLAAAVVMATLLFRLRKRLVPIACAVFLITFPFLFVTGWITVSSFWRGALSDYSKVSVRSSPSLSPGPRIIINIFDEWDYRRSFLTGRHFPQMEGIKKTAFWASQAVAVSGSTNTAIPSYLTGLSVRWVRSSSKDTFMISADSEQGARDLKKYPNIFSEALASGYRIGILGYHHPYCRLFGDMADRCRVFRYEDFQHYTLRYDRYLLQLAGNLWPHRKGDFLSHGHWAFSRTQEFFGEMIRDGSLTFIYAHWPFPHGPFFSLEKGAGVGYEVNLEHTDRAMGRVRSLMEQSGLWDDSIVVFTSDHWFRFGGEATPDYRVPLMIKLPGETSERAYDKRFNMVHLFDLVRAMSSDQIHAGDDVAALLDRYEDPGAAPIPVSDEGILTKEDDGT